MPNLRMPVCGGRVQVGGRRAAERQAQHLERQEAELIQQENEEKECDEERDERLALLAQHAGCQVGNIIDDALDDRLTLGHPGGAVARADPGKENERNDHDDPGQ